jgi:hypothetical protein
MFSRKIQIAILVALTVCGATPTIVEAQTKKRTTTTRRRAKKRPAPAVPVVRYSAPRSSADVASTLAGLTGRTRSGMWGAMVISLTRGDTLYALNAGEEMMPASTMKLFSSAIAFETFGPNYHFSTDALRDAAVGSHNRESNTSQEVSLETRPGSMIRKFLRVGLRVTSRLPTRRACPRSPSTRIWSRWPSLRPQPDHRRLSRSSHPPARFRWSRTSARWPALERD